MKLSDLSNEELHNRKENNLDRIRALEIENVEIANELFVRRYNKGLRRL